MGRDAAVVRQHAGQRQAVFEFGQDFARGQQRQRAAALAQHEQAGGVVDLRVHQQHGGNAAVAQGARRLQLRSGTDLRQDVGRGID